MEGLLIVAGLVVGLLVGFFVARSTSPERGQVKELELALEQEKESLTNYRAKVSQHFSHTAELVEALAANSREIYSHLAEGSQELCGSEVASLKNGDAAISLSANDVVKNKNDEEQSQKLEMESTTAENEKHELLHSSDSSHKLDVESILRDEPNNIDPPISAKKTVGQSDEALIKKNSEVCVDINQHKKKGQVA